MEPLKIFGKIEKGGFSSTTLRNQDIGALQPCTVVNGHTACVQR